MAAMTESDRKPSGPAAAALLSAGVGSLALGAFTFLAENVKSIANALKWYKPAGPLSGKTGLAILVWLVLWAILGKAWQGKDVELGRIYTVTLVLIAIGFLLTFPIVFQMRF